MYKIESLPGTEIERLKHLFDRVTPEDVSHDDHAQLTFDTESEARAWLDARIGTNYGNSLINRAYACAKIVEV